MSGNGWIPPVPAPASNTLAVCVSVPDDSESRQAFFGAMYLLSQAWSWSDEHDADARLASADYWMSQLASIGKQLDMRIDDCGDFMDCQAVIDCLSSGDGAAYINNVVNRGVPYGDNTNLYDTYVTQAIRDTPLAPPPSGCDKDELWAGVRYLVARLDELGRDILEDIIAQTTIVKQLNTLTEAIPIVGDLAASIVNFGVEATPSLLALYDSYSSEATLDEIACAIFEITCQECRYPTFDELLTSYQQWSVIDLLTNPTAQDVMQVIIDAPTYPAETAYRSFQNVLIFTLSVAGRVGDIVGLDVIELYCQIGGAVPSSAWELLCSGCADTPVVPDLLAFNQVNNSAGLFTLDCGAQQVNYVTGQKCAGAWVDHDYSATINVDYGETKTLPVGTKLQFTGYWQSGGGRRIRITLFDAGGVQVHQERIDPLRFSTSAGFTNLPPFRSMVVDWTDGDFTGGYITSVEFGYVP